MEGFLYLQVAKYSILIISLRYFIAIADNKLNPELRAVPDRFSLLKFGNVTDV